MTFTFRFRASAVLLLAAVAGAGRLHAARISLDSPFGPGTLTRDTETNLEWLDIWVTAGLTTNQIVTLKDSALSGFRYATYPEVSNFVSPYLKPFPSTGNQGCEPVDPTIRMTYSPMQLADILELFNLVYVPASDPLTDVHDLLRPSPWPAALFAPQNTDLGNQEDGTILAMQFFFSAEPFAHAEFDIQGVNFPVRGAPYEGDAYFLVRPIGEPSSTWLVCAALILLLIGRAGRFRRPA